MTYATDDPATVLAILEHAPRCFVCGETITDPADAERVNRMFRVQHRKPCTPRAA